MVRLPKDVSGSELIRRLSRMGYEVIRQEGSHIRLKTEHPSVHRISVPNHKTLKVGMLSALLKRIAQHQQMTVDDLLRQLDL